MPAFLWESEATRLEPVSNLEDTGSPVSGCYLPMNTLLAKPLFSSFLPSLDTSEASQAKSRGLPQYLLPAVTVILWSLLLLCSSHQFSGSLVSSPDTRVYFRTELRCLSYGRNCPGQVENERLQPILATTPASWLSDLTEAWHPQGSGGPLYCEIKPL